MSEQLPPLPQKPAANAISFDVLGYEIFMPGGTSKLFYLKSKKKELTDSQSEEFKRLVASGTEIDSATTVPTGAFVVRMGNEAVEFYGMAKLTFMRQATIIQQKPAIIHQ